LVNSNLVFRPRPLPAVQIMRAFAALLVVAGHAMYEALAIKGAQPYGSILDSRFWLAGVDLFFILSGFIMMWTFGGRFGAPGAAREFLTRRIIRIGPPYWFFSALMIVAIKLFSDHVETTSFTPVHALLSFLFIPHLAPQGGIHPILLHGWTLLYEMFFYLVFALALLLPMKSGLIAIVTIFFTLNALANFSGVLPLGLASFLSDPIIFEFLLGIGFYFLQEDGGLSQERLYGILAGCLIAGACAYALGLWSENRFFYFGLPAFASFALGYYLLTDERAHFWMFLVLIGEASYALYLSHPFVLELVKWGFSSAFVESPRFVALYVVSGVTLATLASLAFWNAVERPLNRRLSRWLVAPRKREAAAI
jgi:exopolysaccharide production protein ExoZ